jgi:hypothetical protein
VGTSVAVIVAVIIVIVRGPRAIATIVITRAGARTRTVAPMTDAVRPRAARARFHVRNKHRQTGFDVLSLDSRRLGNLRNRNRNRGGGGGERSLDLLLSSLLLLLLL